VLTDSWLEDAFDEIEPLGFSLCSPYKLIRDKLPSKLTAGELKQHIDKNS
jgi:hypothetical protein